MLPAEKLLRGYIARHGDHPEALRLLAKIALACDAREDAERLLERVLLLSPGYDAARYDYADALSRRHDCAKARIHIDLLSARDPDNADYRLLAATIAIGLGEHELAIAIYRGLVAQGLDRRTFIFGSVMR